MSLQMTLLVITVFVSVGAGFRDGGLDRTALGHARAAADPPADPAAARESGPGRPAAHRTAKPVGQALPAGSPEIAKGDVAAPAPTHGGRLSQPDGRGRLRPRRTDGSRDRRGSRPCL